MEDRLQVVDRVALLVCSSGGERVDSVAVKRHGCGG
jgi:hypothetical protein